jgi:alkanesulfonate monooxygenase SsuD/methylene tetrahydromethanopterin reductase-like flavin-dependent oxidoreductase (luciferase family)
VALGQDFHNRGRRVEEQVAVMRELWTNQLVTFEGEWHRIDNAGMNPRPVQQPIPIWFGAFATPAIERAGRLADGWFANPFHAPGDDAQHDFDLVRESVAATGRDPADFGIDATLNIRKSDPQDWAAEAAAWREMGASHVTVRTMRADLPDIDAHIDALKRFKEVWPG